MDSSLPERAAAIRPESYRKPSSPLRYDATAALQTGFTTETPLVSSNAGDRTPASTFSLSNPFSGGPQAPTGNVNRLLTGIGDPIAAYSVFNAESKFGSVADYEHYTRPYDKRVFDALADTKLTILHLHYLERPYVAQFKDFNAPVLQYSVKTSGIPISEIRAQFSQPIAGEVDEIDYEKLTTDEIRRQWKAAREQAGAKYIAAPGCSVPDASTPEELARFPRALGI
jgi:hypothetical protein